jgi:hypothetical protein
MPKASHGESRGRRRSPEFTAWHGMKQRCYNPNNAKFKDYGGRGIRVCDRWKNSLENFLIDMGRRPSAEHSLDRIDVNGDYCPKNCRWATRSRQASNKRNSKGRMIEVEEGLRREILILADEWGLGVSELVHELLKKALESQRLVKRASGD